MDTRRWRWRRLCIGLSCTGVVVGVVDDVVDAVVDGGGGWERYRCGTGSTRVCILGSTADGDGGGGENDDDDETPTVYASMARFPPMARLDHSRARRFPSSSWLTTVISVF